MLATTSLMQDDTASSLIGDSETAAHFAYKDTTQWFKEIQKRVGGRRFRGKFSIAAYLGDHQDMLRTYRMTLGFWKTQTISRLRAVIDSDQLIGASWGDAREYLRSNLPKGYAKNQWMLNRVARTEIDRSYNGAVVESLKADDRPSDRAHKMDSAIFDGRTHYDSYLNHGQHVPVDRPFVDVLSGREYQYPPNRANDRSIVVGWRESLGNPIDYAESTKRGPGPTARPSLSIPGFR